MALIKQSGGSSGSSALGSMSDRLPEDAHRFIISVIGPPKGGKTDFSLRKSPGPIAYFNVGDRTNRRLIERLQKAGQKITHGYYPIPQLEDIMRPKDSKTVQKNADAAREVLRRLKADWKMAAKSSKFRTLVGDTGGGVWVLIRLARYGKRLEVPPLLYNIANTEFLNFIGDVRVTDKNLILVHRETDEYRSTKHQGKDSALGEKTGNTKPIGHKEIQNEVDAEIRCWRDLKDEREYHAEIQLCGPDGSLAGMDFTGERCSFRYVAAAMWGDRAKDWR